MDYSFTLKYRLPDDDRTMDVLVERLGEAGCTDALVGIGIPGRIALDFTRDAKTARHAVRSALEDVRSAIPKAMLIEASPDFVGLTDVADIVGVSRQSIRKLMLGHDDFPVPVHDGSPSVWHLADVLRWLEGRKGYLSDPRLRETAAAALEVNVAKEALRSDPETTRGFERLIT
ncbi:MAG: DNA-binding protein [Rhizobiaceae bacterium]|nr:DNA-binding protein [Rhizobiaceae bacterium]